MNGTEQRRHATVAERVDKHVADLTDALDVLDARLFEVASKGQETRREVNELRVHLANLNRRVDELSTAHDVVAHRLPWPNTFRGRLRWLFRGV